MIDENDAPEGYKAVADISTHVSCKGCAFAAREKCTNFETACTRGSRDDGLNVIFIKRDPA